MALTLSLITAVVGANEAGEQRKREGIVVDQKQEVVEGI